MYVHVPNQITCAITSLDLYVDFSAQQSSENTSKRKLGNQVSISLV